MVPRPLCWVPRPLSWLPRPLCCECALVAALFLAAVYEVQAAAVFPLPLIAVWCMLGASSPEFEEGTGAALLFGSAVYSLCVLATRVGASSLALVGWVLSFSSGP
jgi:hypothetical protein